MILRKFLESLACTNDVLIEEPSTGVNLSGKDIVSLSLGWAKFFIKNRTVKFELSNHDAIGMIAYIGAAIAGVEISPSRVQHNVQSSFFNEFLSDSELDFLLKTNENKPSVTMTTSGSTMAPKKIRHTLENLIVNSIAFCSHLNLSKENSFYACLSRNFMAGVLNSFVLPMTIGAKIILGDVFDIRSVTEHLDMIESTTVTHTWITPSMLHAFLLEKKNRTLKNLTMLSCADRLPLQTKKQINQTYNCNVLSSYGLTETLIVTCQQKTADQSEDVGAPLPGVNLRIENDGELIITAPWLAHDVGVSNFFSGDFAQLNGNIVTILGRKKNVIKRGGVLINPVTIQALIENKMGLDCIILGVPDDLIGEKIYCVYSSQKISVNQMQTIRKLVMNEFNKLCTIDRFYNLDTIPLLQSGKPDKQKLIKLVSC